MHGTLALLALASLSACGTSTDALTASISWHQPVGEIVDCHYFKLDNDEAFDIGRFKVDFPLGSHHVHLYRSDTPEPDGVVPCSAGIDWMRWRLLVAVQTQPLDWRLPDDVVAEIAPHQQLMVQVHWINASAAAVSPTISIRLERGAGRSKMGAVLGVSQDVAMQPGESKEVGSWIDLPAGAHLLRAMGHYHTRGVRYTVARQAGHVEAAAPIYRADGPDAFPFLALDDQAPIADGEALDYRCSFENLTGGPITWGPDVMTQEHCNLALYYHPAGADPSRVVVSGGVQSLTMGAIAAGQSATATVTLPRAAGSDGTDVQITASAGLSAPARMHVGAWADRADFTVTGVAAGPATLSATTGATTVDCAVTVSE